MALTWILIQTHRKKKKKAFMKCRALEPASPKCATFAWGLFWAKGNQAPTGSKETTAPPFEHLEEFKLRIFSQKRVITSNKFYLSGPIYVAEQTPNYQTSALLIGLWRPSSLWKPHAPIPSLSSGWHICLILPFCLWTSHVCVVETKQDPVGPFWVQKPFCVPHFFFLFF